MIPLPASDQLSLNGPHSPHLLLPPPRSAPHSIVHKTMELAYYLSLVLDKHIPALEHGHDGLIFTCAESGYVVGTDEMM